MTPRSAAPGTISEHPVAPVEKEKTEQLQQQCQELEMPQLSATTGPEFGLFAERE